MTEREKELIEAYIPNKKDISLEEDEYYVLTANNTIQKGSIRDIGCGARDEILYRLRNNRGIVYSWASDNLGFVAMRHLYDNKQDCKNQTHFAYDDWEKLRKLENNN